MTEQIFKLWCRFTGGEITRSTLRNYMNPLQVQVEDLLVKGMACDNEKTVNTCYMILRLAPSLWTFVRVKGIELTDNAAERALRHGVLWRQGSFGTASEDGSRFAERMMTI